MRTLLPLVLLAACTPDADAPGDTDTTTPIAWCEGTVTQRWDPLRDASLATFPDAIWTRADDASPTGLRVDVSGAPWLAEMPTGIVDLEGPLADLSGFGRIAATVLRFDGALGEVPTTAEASLVDEGLILAELTPEGPVRVPYRATTGTDGVQLLIQPLAVLSPGARHVAILTTAHVAADGGCVTPSPTFRRLMEGADVDPRLAALEPGFTSALDALGLRPADVSAMTTFTTHDDVATSILAAADDVAGRTYAWDAPPACAVRGHLRHCTGTFTAHDYRTAGSVVDGVSHGTWSLGVDVWLPKDTAHAPVVMYGHGMNGDRGAAGGFAEDMTADGYAVIATDALFHGDHPTTAGLSMIGGLPFLGLDLDAGQLSLRQVRGSFGQTPLDRAQALALLRDVPDIDGDGTGDVDPSRVGYLGVSLGGLLGPGLMIAHPDTGAGVLQVAGGHLVVFVTSTGVTQQIHPVLVGLVGDEDGLDRFLAVGQAAVDAADPVVLADHLTGRHGFAGAGDVLQQGAEFDVVVPPPTGEMLARGLQAPRLAPGAWPVDGVVDGPARTDPVVGYQQFEQITVDGVLVDADHNDTPGSPEAYGQALRFLAAWRDTGTAEITPPTAE